MLAIQKAGLNPMLELTAVTMFLKELEERVTRMASARSTSSYELIRDEAHVLKGISGTFGAPALARAALRLEEACHLGKVLEADDLVDTIRGLSADTSTALERYFEIEGN